MDKKNFSFAHVANKTIGYQRRNCHSKEGQSFQYTDKIGSFASTGTKLSDKAVDLLLSYILLSDFIIKVGADKILAVNFRNS